MDRNQNRMVQKNYFRLILPIPENTSSSTVHRIYNVKLPLDGGIWPWLLENPEIPIGVTEGAKNRCLYLLQGFYVCNSVIG